MVCSEAMEQPDAEDKKYHGCVQHKHPADVGRMIISRRPPIPNQHSPKCPALVASARVVAQTTATAPATTTPYRNRAYLILFHTSKTLSRALSPLCVVDVRLGEGWGQRVNFFTRGSGSLPFLDKVGFRFEPPRQQRRGACSSHFHNKGMYADPHPTPTRRRSPSRQRRRPTLRRLLLPSVAREGRENCLETVRGGGSFWMQGIEGRGGGCCLVTILGHNGGL